MWRGGDNMWGMYKIFNWTRRNHQSTSAVLNNLYNSEYVFVPEMKGKNVRLSRVRFKSPLCFSFEGGYGTKWPKNYTSTRDGSGGKQVGMIGMWWQQLCWRPVHCNVLCWSALPKEGWIFLSETTKRFKVPPLNRWNFTSQRKKVISL